MGSSYTYSLDDFIEKYNCGFLLIIFKGERMMTKKDILVHACCAPCAGYVLEKLAATYNPVVYYFNPNIYPLTEYIRRRDELALYCQKHHIPFHEESGFHHAWQMAIQGLEHEPEKGLRCLACFRFRLNQSAQYAAANHYASFTTTLTISPHKVSQDILAIGQAVSEKYGVHFLSEDFKKKDGYRLATAIAKREQFYRQKYCGCAYSITEKN